MNRSSNGNHASGRRLRDNLLKDFRGMLEAEPEKEEEEAEESPEEEWLDAHVLVRDAIEARATDIHLDPLPDRYRVRLRIDGQLVDAVEMNQVRGRRLVNQFKVLAGIDPVPAFSDAEGAYQLELGEDEEIFVRVASVHCMSGDKASVRLLTPPESFEDIAELGIRGAGIDWIRNWMNATGGMLVVAGPTGSGKTTTLYTLLHQLKFVDCQVVTIEDPVEYMVPGINQIEVDESRGWSFDTVTPALLRLDPDYVLIGEIRDQPSAEAAVAVSSSGRSLMGTLHSRDAAGAITSLRNLGLADHEIAANLGLVIAQRLVRKLCPQCRERAAPDETAVTWLEACGLEVPDETWVARGCDACRGLGYRGRIGIFEIWQLTPDDYAMILRNEDEHTIRRALLERGQALMVDDGLEKVDEGITTVSELFRMGALLPTYEFEYEEDED